MNLLMEIIKAISILIASGVAIYGINSWRREQTWKKKYELAEEVLALVYEVEDSIKNIRNPFYNLNEGKTRVKGENEEKRESELYDRAFVVFERYDKNKEPINKLRVVKYRFMTIYGSNKAELFAKINSLINEIFHAANLLGNIYWQNQGSKDWESDVEFKKHLKEKWEYEKIIWSIGENDEFELKLKEIISEFECVCKAIINKKHIA